MSRKHAVLVLIGLVAAAAGFAQPYAKNGVYFAESKDFDITGWKDQVIITVERNKIAKVLWNSVSNMAGIPDKKQYAASGGYGMKKVSRLRTEWDRQAAIVEAWLVKNQAIDFSAYDGSGKTNAISGASIAVNVFFELARKALLAPAVERGSYSKDGWFYAEQPDFDPITGWKETVLVTVVNGRIVDLIWNGIYKDSSKKSKIVESVSGKYFMALLATKGDWHKQANAVEQAIIKAQDPAKIPVKPDGTSDAVSGATIHLWVVGLTAKALQAAR